MLHTYGYGVKEGASEITCLNYYTNEPITVPLDPFSSVSANAQRYLTGTKTEADGRGPGNADAETENDRSSWRLPDFCGTGGK
jgi:predicted ribosome quality control (RQC) complex YloA/Tae2 family protein